MQVLSNQCAAADASQAPNATSGTPENNSTSSGTPASTQSGTPQSVQGDTMSSANKATEEKKGMSWGECLCCPFTSLYSLLCTVVYYATCCYCCKPEVDLKEVVKACDTAIKAFEEANGDAAKTKAALTAFYKQAGKVEADLITAWVDAKRVAANLKDDAQEKAKWDDNNKTNVEAAAKKLLTDGDVSVLSTYREAVQKKVNAAKS